MSNSDKQSTAQVERRRHTLTFVVCCTTGGVLGSGMLWLALYDLRYTPTIGMDGPAVYGLLAALVGGWLLSALFSLIAYASGNKSKEMAQAVAIVIVSGLLAGYGVGCAVGGYAAARYQSSFCKQHKKMCID